MRLRVLGCAGGSAPGAQLSCYLLDDVLAVDAGALTTALDFGAQRRVQDILLTHAHLDHVWTLPLFLANRFGGPPVPCRIHGASYALETVRQHLFNDRIWPDFTEAVRESVPLVQFSPIDPGDVRKVLDYEVTSIALVHAVPSQAYLLRKGRSSLLVCGDTYSTDRLWEIADATPDLRGILIECSFPSRYDGLARASLHLTPRLLSHELEKLHADVPVLVTHIKPEDRAEVVAELEALRERRLRILRDGDVLDV
ncbi:MAG: 3',5'-cyclic-nucleotide phosphodiesterase [Planctomycetes bacterium]|nr:3',5'-cyclic-nucleotide phosphodiesterase [Planctomycetota bacterium]